MRFWRNEFLRILTNVFFYPRKIRKTVFNDRPKLKIFWLYIYRQLFTRWSLETIFCDFSVLKKRVNCLYLFYKFPNYKIYVFHITPALLTENLLLSTGPACARILFLSWRIKFHLIKNDYHSWKKSSTRVSFVFSFNRWYIRIVFNQFRLIRYFRGKMLKYEPTIFENLFYS